MPAPVSRTAMTVAAGRRRARISTFPPCGVYWIAFDMKFADNSVYQAGVCSDDDAGSAHGDSNACVARRNAEPLHHLGAQYAQVDLLGADAAGDVELGQLPHVLQQPLQPA